MSSDPWDDLPTGNFIQWETIGAEVVGDVIGKGVGDDFNGNSVPQLVIQQDDTEVVTLTAGQANLRAALLAAKPKVGDRIKIVYTHQEPPTVKGRDPKKCFKVTVKAGAGKAPAQPATPPAAVVVDDDDF